MTGRRNRIHTATNFGLRHSAGRMPCKPKSGTFSLREKSGSSPLRPRRSFPQGISHRESRYLTRSRGKYFFLLALYLDQKNWTQRISNFSKQPRGSVRTSFGCCSICLRNFLVAGRRKRCGVAPPPTGSLEVFCTFRLLTILIILFL